MKCWRCGEEVDAPEGRLSFRAVCDHCGVWLHCCRNCRHYRPGLPNDCAIPDTEYIADREASNFCEDFAALGAGPPPRRPSAEDVAKRLFRDDHGEGREGI